MTAIVPMIPSYPAEYFVRGGSTVKSLTMQDAAKTLMWAIGRGGQLVPCYSPSYSLASGATARFKFRVQPRYQAFSRLWTVTARGASGNAGLSFNTAVPAGGSAKYHNTGVTRAGVSPVIHYHHLSSQSSSETELSIDIDNDGAVGLVIESIGCFEIPRLELALGASDYGVDVETLAHRQPIYDGAGKSVGGLYDTANAAFNIAQRNGMFHHAWPIITSGAGTTSATRNITSTSYVTLWSSAGGVTRTAPQLARKRDRDGVSGYDLRSVAVGALAAVSGGTGNVRFTMTNGSSIELTISSTDTTFGGTSAGSWQTDSVSVDAEDLNSSNGLRDSTWDLATIEAKKNTSGTLYLASVSMWGG